MKEINAPTEKGLEPEEDAPVWVHPRSWKTDNRTRQYITLIERGYSREADFDMLRRSVKAMLKRQDARGSFHSDAEYCTYDKVDDQLGYAAALAYYLSRTGPDPTLNHALEQAVRFHVDHLVFRSPDQPYPYSRALINEDSPNDWCNTLWCLGNGATALHYAVSFLTERTAQDLRRTLRDCWSYIEGFRMRDENPCHNQLLAYCEIGLLVSAEVGDPAIKAKVLAYYHQRLRRVRIRDRGHLIYSEFGKWDIHYSVLSWMVLERLFVMTGDPAFREDADEIALAFREQVSAGGYYWGGSRNNECGVDEFPQLFTARDAELDFRGLLFPEPSHLWRHVTIEGHGGRGLVERIATVLPSRPEKRPLAPTPWHFQAGNASVCLDDDSKTHLISSAGLELISVPSMGGVAAGLRWLADGVWKEDALQVHPPKRGELLSYYDSQPIRAGEVSGVTSMQRGYYWETRQWWLSTGQGLLWVGQVTPHFAPVCEQVHFALGNPVLTRASDRPTPVSEVQTAEGTRSDTQGEAATVSSARFLRFGDVFVGATAPLAFVRPSGDAFHTFPTAYGRFWRDFTSSNEVRVLLDETSRRWPLRESVFFAVEIGEEAPQLEVSQAPLEWRVKSRLGSFVARRSAGVWQYKLEGGSGESDLPYIGFGFSPAP